MIATIGFEWKTTVRFHLVPKRGREKSHTHTLSLSENYPGIILLQMAMCSTVSASLPSVGLGMCMLGVGGRCAQKKMTCAPFD